MGRALHWQEETYFVDMLCEKVDPNKRERRHPQEMSNKCSWSFDHSIHAFIQQQI